jgi:hypothetical protein
LQVWSRWGELVFQQENFPPSQEAYGWDGRFRGRPVDPGVLVWYAEVRFADGEILKFKGDVSVLK